MTHIFQIIPHIGVKQMVEYSLCNQSKTYIFEADRKMSLPCASLIIWGGGLVQIFAHVFFLLPPELETRLNLVVNNTTVRAIGISNTAYPVVVFSHLFFYLFLFIYFFFF